MNMFLSVPKEAMEALIGAVRRSLLKKFKVGIII